MKMETPGHILTIGPTGCGRSRWVVDTLRGPMRGKFNVIFLICPMYPYNQAYRGFAQGEPSFVALAPDPSDEAEVDELWRLWAILFDQREVLFIVDNCAFSKDIKNRSSELIRLAFSGRQSVWVLTQLWGSVAKLFRDNCSFVVAFHSPSARECDALLEKVGAGLAREEETQLMHPVDVLLEIRTSFL